MKISGSSVLHASPDRVWAAVTDPAVLSAVIPGCDVLTPTAANTFALTVTLGVASIKGSYTGEVSFSDLVEPSSLTMRAKGSGGPGTIDTTVAVVLNGLSDGSTRLDYDADAMVGGMVGGVGQRVLAGVAKKTAGVFFAAIDEVLTGTRPLAAPAVPAPAAVPAAAAPAVPGAAAASFAPQSFPQRAYSLIGAAAFGAVSMLVGVLVGARITRRATRARRP
jgi:carbon monoxide dehydrogenase subunit G